MLYTIWYHLHNFKNVKNTHTGALLTKNNTPPWVFFTLSKLYNGTKTSKASHMDYPFKKPIVIYFEKYLQH